MIGILNGLFGGANMSIILEKELLENTILPLINFIFFYN